MIGVLAHAAYNRDDGFANHNKLWLSILPTDTGAFLDQPAEILKSTLGVVLAGGASRRMGGGDKAFLALGGKPLIAHVLDRLRAQLARVAINANGDADRFAQFGVPVFGDGVRSSEGPACGILASLDWGAARGAQWIVTAPTDTPFLPHDLAGRLIGAALAANAPLAFAADDTHAHPTVGAWSLAVRDKMIELMDRRGMRAVHMIGAALGAITVRFEAPKGRLDPFFNVNTPADLARAQDWIAQA